MPPASLRGCGRHLVPDDAGCPVTAAVGVPPGAPRHPRATSSLCPVDVPTPGLYGGTRRVYGGCSRSGAAAVPALGGVWRARAAAVVPQGGARAVPPVASRVLGGSAATLPAPLPPFATFGCCHGPERAVLRVEGGFGGRLRARGCLLVAGQCPTGTGLLPCASRTTGRSRMLSDDEHQGGWLWAFGHCLPGRKGGFSLCV